MTVDFACLHILLHTFSDGEEKYYPNYGRLQDYKSWFLPEQTKSSPRLKATFVSRHLEVFRLQIFLSTNINWFAEKFFTKMTEWLVGPQIWGRCVDGGTMVSTADSRLEGRGFDTSGKSFYLNRFEYLFQAFFFSNVAHFLNFKLRSVSRKDGLSRESNPRQ